MKPSFKALIWWTIATGLLGYSIFLGFQPPSQEITFKNVLCDLALFVFFGFMMFCSGYKVGCRKTGEQ